MACETISRATYQRIAVKMKPLMIVPESESKGFFTCSLLRFVSVLWPEVARFESGSFPYAPRS
jgi:hypothetical protein